MGYFVDEEEGEEDYNEETTVWHITGLNSASNIMQNGFIPQPTNHGLGVSVSINKQSAAGLLKAAQRLFSFNNYEEMKNWFVSMGAEPNDVENKINQTLKRIRKQQEEAQGDIPKCQVLPTNTYM